MNVVVQVLNFISQEILNVPAYLIGIIAAIGLIALKRSAGPFCHANDCILQRT